MNYNTKLYKLRENLSYYFSKKISYPLHPPRNVTLTLNYLCNQNCIMCGIKKRPFNKDHALSVEEIKHNIIDEMVKMKIPELVLTGGEPFLYDGIFNVIDYAKQQNLKIVMITNAFYDDTIMHQILKKNIDHLQISLDGADAQTYDSIRRIPGSFATVSKNIKKFTDNKISVGATVTIMQQNFKQLIQIAQLAKELGCSRLALRPAHVDNSNPQEKETLSNIWIAKEKLPEFNTIVEELKNFNTENNNYLDFSPGLDQLKDYFKNGHLPPHKCCYIGYNRLIISYNEKDSFEAWMCGGMFGDIRKKSLKKVWYSTEAKHLRKQIKHCKQTCLFPELYEPQLENLSSIIKNIL